MQAQGKGDARPAIVQIDGEAKDGARTQGVVRLDDAARYREQAKYEADKKRRESATGAAASAQGKPGTSESTAAARVKTGEGKAEISWSTPPQPESHVATESSDATLKN
jgi:hypothetical protein